MNINGLKTYPVPPVRPVSRKDEHREQQHPKQEEQERDQETPADDKPESDGHIDAFA